MNIGIDLGTYASSAALPAGTGKPVLIGDVQNKDKTRTPSVFVAIPNGVLVGELAWQLHDTRPTQAPVWRYQPTQLATNQRLPGAEGHSEWLAETLAGLMIRKLKTDAETMTGQAITGMVLTIPNYLTGEQQNALRGAAQMAALPVLQVLTEAEAIATHYQPTGHKPFVVMAWGYNRLTVSILTKTGGQFAIKTTHTLPAIGNERWDDALADQLSKRYQAAGLTTSAAPVVVPARTVEPLKEALSTVPVTRQFLFMDQQLVDSIVSRHELELVVKPDLARATQLVMNCLTQAELDPQDIDEVLIAGGSMLQPVVRQWVGRLFGANCRCYDQERLYAAVLGAARCAAQSTLTAAIPDLTGVTSHHIGIRIVDPATRAVTIDTVIQQHVLLPAKGQRTYYSTNNAQQFIVLDVVQYAGHDSGDHELMGQLTIGPLPARPLNCAVNVTFLCADDGQLAISTNDPETGDELAQQFQTKSVTAFPFAHHQQLIRGMAINGLY